MNSPVGPRPARLAPRRRALADADVAALLEAMPGLPLPPELQTRWPVDDRSPERRAARAAAYARMVGRGVLTRSPAGPDDLIDAMNPAVFEALTLPGAADVVVLVRSWCRDTSFVAGFALSGERGVGMVRRWEVPAGGGAGVGSNGRAVARPGLELSAFLADSLLPEILRTVPPVEGHPPGAAAGVDVRALDSAALVAALRDRRPDIVGALCERAGLATTPPELEDLADRWEGGLDVSLRRPGGSDALTGTWWLAGGRWLRALVSGAGGDAPFEGLLELRPTTRAVIEADLLAALVRLSRAEVDDGG